MKRKTYYDLEVSKERRLWYSEIRHTITPLIIAGSIIFSDEKNRDAVKKACSNAKNKITGLFKH